MLYHWSRVLWAVITLTNSGVKKPGILDIALVNPNSIPEREDKADFEH